MSRSERLPRTGPEWGPCAVNVLRNELGKIQHQSESISIDSREKIIGLVIKIKGPSLFTDE